VVLSGHTIQATIGVTVSHTRQQLQGGDFKLPQWKDNGRTSCPRVIEITLGVEFAKMNELTGTITLSSGVQARILDKSLVDSLEGTVV
jgi:hypothetical protein